MILYEFIRYFLIQKKRVMEEIIFHIGSKYSLPERETFFLMEICNCYTPDPIIVQVLKGLKQKQFRIYLFSNIGTQFFQHLKKENETVFELFDGFHTSGVEINYVTKPDAVAYQRFCERFASVEEGLKKIIFVDDSKDNLEAAEKISSKFRGILFTTSECLKQDLTRIRILD